MLKAISIFVDEYRHRGGKGMKRDLELKL